MGELYLMFTVTGAVVVFVGFGVGMGELVTRWRERRRQRFLKTGKKR